MKEKKDKTYKLQQDLRVANLFRDVYFTSVERSKTKKKQTFADLRTNKATTTTTSMSVQSDEDAMIEKCSAVQACELGQPEREHLN